MKEWWHIGGLTLGSIVSFGNAGAVGTSSGEVYTSSNLWDSTEKTFGRSSILKQYLLQFSVVQRQMYIIYIGSTPHYSHRSIIMVYITCKCANYIVCECIWNFCYFMTNGLSIKCDKWYADKIWWISNQAHGSPFIVFCYFPCVTACLPLSRTVLWSLQYQLENSEEYEWMEWIDPPVAPFTNYGLTLIPAWISNHIR